MTPKEVVNVINLGYLGVEKDFPEQLSSLLCKKKRNQEELSVEEENSSTNFILNRGFDRDTICKVKKYKILTDVFRNGLRKYNRISNIV